MTKTFASTQSGLTARVTAEAHVETIATTLLTSMSLRAARTPASAFVWSSSWKSCTGRPWIPPALLIRSTTATTERCMSGPYEPPAPVSGHRVPMLIGAFDCAERIAGAGRTGDPLGAIEGADQHRHPVPADGGGRLVRPGHAALGRGRRRADQQGGRDPRPARAALPR